MQSYSSNFYMNGISYQWSMQWNLPPQRSGLPPRSTNICTSVAGEQFFPHNCGNNPSEFGVPGMVCSYQSKPNFQNWTNLTPQSSPLQTMVSLTWISYQKLMHHYHYAIQSTGSMQLDWCKFWAIDKEIDPTWDWTSCFIPPMLTWQTCLFGSK